jgi:hypothetical protein
MILIKELDANQGEIGLMKNFSKKKLDEMIWGYFGADDGFYVSNISFGRDEYCEISITILSRCGKMERFLIGTYVVRY